MPKRVRETNHGNEEEERKEKGLEETRNSSETQEEVELG